MRIIEHHTGYFVTVMTHGIALEAGQSSQGTHEHRHISIIHSNSVHVKLYKCPRGYKLTESANLEINQPLAVI